LVPNVNFFNQLAGQAALGDEQALMTNFAGCLPKLSTKKKIKKWIAFTLSWIVGY